MMDRLARRPLNSTQNYSSPLTPAKAGAQKLRLALIACAAGALAACGGSDEPAQPASKTVSTETAASEASTPAAAQTQTAQNTSPGKQIFDAQCSYCHAPGDDHPGTLQLGVTRGAEFAVLEQREDLTADYVKYIVRHGLNAMPPFKPTVVTDAQLDELAAYLAKTE